MREPRWHWSVVGLLAVVLLSAYVAEHHYHHQPVPVVPWTQIEHVDNAYTGNTP